MAELNDKLITYGNLSTFYDKLQEQGLGGNAIEEVSELPNASENKDKLFRLDNGEKDVYAAKLLSSETTTTNRLPDAQQIDKAYLYDTEDSTINYYKGAYHIICNDGETDGYLWYQEGYPIMTLKNAETITDADNRSDYYEIGESITINESTKTITVDDILSALSALNMGTQIPIPAIYNAPESAQIGNATLIDGANEFTGVYTGTQVTFIDTDGSGEEVTGYKWAVDGETDFIATSKPASEIYGYCNEDAKISYGDFTVWCVYPEDDNSSEMTNFNRGLYIPQLNAPDSEQVDNAYLEIGGQYQFIYKGEITAYFTDGNLQLFRWYDATQPYNVYTINSANSIYSLPTTGCQSEENIELYYDSEEDIYKSTELSVASAQEAFNAHHSIDLGDVSTVKYQRTEVTEEWGWQPLTDNATNDDIDLMFAAPVPPTPIVKRTLIRYQDAEQEAEGFIDWLVNTSGETMEFEGQTYYKWVSWGNDHSQAPVEND